MGKSLLFVILFVISSCGVKQSQKMISSGDYDRAIERSVSALRNNKDKKSKQEYIYLLQEGYAKANERDWREIDLLVKDASPRNLERLFTIYVGLNERQESIRPLLPLRLLAEDRHANFEFKDYSEQIVSSKRALSKYLYDNTKALLATNDKQSHRRAYGDLLYLEQINPGYQDVRSLMEEARFKGTDFVSVYTKNETGMMIPQRLQDDLLDFSTYGLNDNWTVYHSNRQQGISYDYGIIVNFRQINISPERINKNEFTVEKEIIDGKKKLLDRRGQVVTDSLGQAVMVDNVKIVRAVITEYVQQKAAEVAAKVDYINFQSNQLLETFPLASQFIFENRYARYRGDIRAVDPSYHQMFNQRAMPFPSNEQMVFDSGEDLKAKLKTIITSNKFPR